MKNLIKLTKINLLTFFSIYKIKNATTSQEKKKELRKFYLLIFVFIYFGYFLFKFANSIVLGLNSLNIDNVLLPAFMAITSSYLLFTSIFKVNKTLFNSKDYSFLLSLPIKKTTIISSKIIHIYLLNMIYCLLFMIPCYIAYILNCNTTLIFNINYFISLIFIPIIPTIIGCIIGTILTGISSRFKHKNIMNIAISLSFFIVVMIFSYSSGSLTNKELADISNTLVKVFNNVYPLTDIYTKLISGSFIYLLLFVSISILAYELYKIIVVKFFDVINNRLSSITLINKYNDKMNKQRSVINSLYKKEFKKYFSSSVYVMNTAIGGVLLTLSIIMFVIMGPEKLENLLEIDGLKNMFTLYAPLLFSLFCALSCTTFPSISLEGKNLWILKTLPINTKDIFKAKILLNLTITLPVIIINSIILFIYLRLSLYTLILMIITPTIFSLFMAAFGLIINLLFPDFEWTSEVKVIKQSFSNLITIFSGLIITIIPLTIKTKLNSNIYSLLICIIFIIISIIVYSILYTTGKKKFEKLQV